MGVTNSQKMFEYLAIHINHISVLIMVDSIAIQRVSIICREGEEMIYFVAR